MNKKPEFTINADQRSFTANGIEYTLRDEISIGRFKHLQLFKIWMQLPVDEGTLLGLLTKVYEKIPYIMRDPAQGQSLQIEMYQYLEGLKKKIEEGDVSLWICTLFFNTKEENFAEWTVDLGREKIKIWEEAGAPASFFLGVTIPLIENSMKNYEKFMQNILNQKRAEMETLEGEMD